MRNEGRLANGAARRLEPGRQRLATLHQRGRVAVGGQEQRVLLRGNRLTELQLEVQHLERRIRGIVEDLLARRPQRPSEKNRPEKRALPRPIKVAKT